MTLPVPSLVIQERTGARRRVVLKGRALPYRPIEFPVDQRVDISNPAGLQSGVSTILGPTYGSTTFSGMWKDKFLGRTSSIDSCYMAVDSVQVSTIVEAEKLFTSILEQGQELDVQWGPVYRRGHLKAFKPKWLNVADMEWSLEFVWLSRGSVVAASYAPNRDPPTDLSNSMLERLTQAMRNFRRSFRWVDDYQERVLRTAQQLGAFTEELNATVATVDSANPMNLAEFTARNTIVAAGNIVSAASQAVDTARNNQALAFLDDYRLLGTTPGLPPETIPPDVQVEATVSAREQERLFRDMRDDAAAYARARSAGDNEILGTYRTREGEDLRDVSRIYYGTPYEWRRIMEYNELNTSEVPAGTLLVIPRGNDEEEGGDNV